MNATANLHDEHKQLVIMHSPFSDDAPESVRSDVMGDLRPSAEGMFTTSNPELAAEMQEKYGDGVQVAPYRTTGKPLGRISFTMPQLPYETEWDRRHKEKERGD